MKASLFWISGATEREIFDGGGREAGDQEADRASIPHAAAGPDGSATVLLRFGKSRRVALPE